MYTDAHTHWTDLRMPQFEQPGGHAQAEKMMQIMNAKNITTFMEAGVNPEGWLRQIELQKKYPENFKLALGLHPYFVAENEIQTCEEALDQLSHIINFASAIGETGLDFRDQYTKKIEEDDLVDKQILFFENQIQLAIQCHKPLVLHVVKAHEDALKILKLWDADLVGGMVHAFNSSYDIAKKYIDLGFLISVGGAITYPKNKNLIDAVKKIPLEKMLIESDAPDQAPLDWVNDDGSSLNSSLSVLKVATAIAEIKGVPLETVARQTTVNFKTLFR